jgi:hypothetical protein
MYSYGLVGTIIAEVIPIKKPAPLKIQLMAACLQAIVRQCGATALLATT